MENPDFIGMPALRSALKIIYTPGITLKTPIGLRNDPQAAGILEQGREIDSQFQEAVNYLDPFDRRDYLEWVETADGIAFTNWKQRAFALAAALKTLETGWEQNDEKPVQTIPTEVQNAVDRAWYWDHHRHWFLVTATTTLTFAFMGSGPNMSFTTWIVIAMLLGITAVAVGAYAISYLPRWQLKKIVKKHGMILEPLGETEKTQPLETDPLWVGSEQALTSARILNFANWAMLSLPAKERLLDLTPGEINSTARTERHQKIAETAAGWIAKEKAKRERLASLTTLEKKKENKPNAEQ